MGQKPKSSPSLTQVAPVTPPSPPVTQNSREVIEAGEDMRRQQMARKSVKNTIKAGDMFTTPNVGAKLPKPF
jgi:hypothetical protein